MCDTLHVTFREQEGVRGGGGCPSRLFQSRESAMLGLHVVKSESDDWIQNPKRKGADSKVVFPTGISWISAV